jgi:hypothetical protein
VTYLKLGIPARVTTASVNSLQGQCAELRADGEDLKEAEGRKLLKTPGRAIMWPRVVWVELWPCEEGLPQAI